MCWALFYHANWTMLSYGYNDGLSELGSNEPTGFLWPKWDGVFELQGWLNGACNNL